MRLFLIFGVPVLFFSHECASTRTVVFIYDKVNVTEYDINQLSGNIKNVSNRLFEDGLDFNFKMVVPYKSYIEEISNNTISSNYFSFEGQGTLRDLLIHLTQSPSFSVIYVITNGTTCAKNDTSVEQILEEIQIKRAQVNFLIGTEFSFAADSFQEYGFITTISNGFIIGPKLFQFDKFTDFVHLRLSSVPQKIRMMAMAVQQQDSGTYCANMDSFLKTATKDLILSGFDISEYELHPGKPERTSIISNAFKKDAEWIMTLSEVTNSTTTPTMCSDFYKKSNPEDFFYLTFQGFSKNDFDFDYGFSMPKSRSLNKIYRRPIKGVSNKIYVSPSDKNFQYGFHRFKILFLNGTYFGEEIPLQPIESSDLFVGSFKPPNGEYFYIEVTSNVNDGTTVSRISSTAMSATVWFGHWHNPFFQHKPYFKHKPSIKIEHNSVSFTHNPSLQHKPYFKLKPPIKIELNSVSSTSQGSPTPTICITISLKAIFIYSSIGLIIALLICFTPFKAKSWVSKSNVEPVKTNTQNKVKKHVSFHKSVKS